MLKLEALKARIIGLLGVSGPAAFAFNKTPLRPDRCITLTEIPGGVSELDTGELDNPYFQARCRSEKNEPQQARDDAAQLDRIIMDAANWPTDLGGSWAVCAGRLGGPPHWMSTDDEGRTTYVCNYFLKLQR